MTQPVTKLTEPPKPARIPIPDELDLIWFLGYGQTLFCGSNFGDLLERAHSYRYAKGAVSCKDCDGTGFQGKEELACETCYGMGFVPRRIKSGEPENLTARPTCHMREPPGHVPRDEDLARFAKVGRRLDAVCAVSAEAGRVLSAYYGDKGTRWDVNGRGRIFALCPLTDSGAELLKRSQKRSLNAIVLEPSETLGVEAELQRTQPNRKRRELLQAANLEALALYRQAVTVWIEVRHEERARLYDAQTGR